MKRKYATSVDFDMPFEQFYNFLCARGVLRIPLRKLKKNEPIVTIWMGLSGSGKTTIASALSSKCFKNCVPVYANVNIKNTFELSPHDDIGNFSIHHAKLIIDEAGIDYSNRNHKTNLSHEALDWYKRHRHYHCSIDIFSQAMDMDNKFRELAHKYYILHKSNLFPFIIIAKPLKVRFEPDENGQVIKKFSYWPFGLFNKYYFAPSYWKLFNSFSVKKLKQKVFKFHTDDQKFEDFSN